MSLNGRRIRAFTASANARLAVRGPSEPDPIVLYRCVLFRQYNHQDLHASHKLPEYVGLDV